MAWILPGDAEYRGENAARWQRIGQAVFGGRPHAPVTLHPGGGHWYGGEFRDEAWLDFIGYQSGHASAEKWLGWIPTGEPATAWRIEPARPIINLEPNYEYHLDQSDRTRRFDAFDVRRAVYWSLLATPTAGVTYGGHGVWGWDDGTRPPVNHPNTGVPLPWRQALTMPGAEQMAHVAELFGSLPWWRLRPAPELVAVQPGSRRLADTSSHRGHRHGRCRRLLHAARRPHRTQPGAVAPGRRPSGSIRHCVQTRGRGRRGAA